MKVMKDKKLKSIDSAGSVIPKTLSNAPGANIAC
jgi:hypothetical protein